MEEQSNPIQSSPEAETDEKYFNVEDSQTNSTEKTSKTDLTQPFSWQAREGLQNNHDTTWYVVFGAVILGLMTLAIFVFKSYTFAVLIPVMAVAIILLSSKEPRMINYSVSPKGIYIGDKLYDFSEFRAFGVIQEPDYASIIVLPVKRFAPGLTLYFDEKDGETIVDMLGARLPMQEVKPDSLEKLIRLLRL